MNLETELYRVEFSNSNDKIGYEEHSYNGFYGAQDDETYYNHLDKLYIDYFNNVRANIESLLINNRTDLLRYLQDKIILFDSIKANFKEKSYMDWDSYIYSSEKYYSDAIKTNIGAKNEYNTAKFFKRMSDTQLLFIEKCITELNQIYNIYDPNSSSQKITQEQIEKDTWDNTLSEYGDIVNTFDLAKIFDKDETTIRRWAREGVLTPIDKKKRPMQFKKDDIKRYYLKIKP